MFSQGFKSPMGDAASPVAVFRNVGDSGVIFDQRPDLNTAKVSQSVSLACALLTREDLNF